MELKRRWDHKKVLVRGYFGLLAIYLVVGLTPARAVEYEVTTQIVIPKIGLNADVMSMSMRDGVLETPDNAVGSYSRAENKTFLVGHASGVFGELDKIAVGDEIDYDLLKYTVAKIEIVKKDQIAMNALLAPADTDTIVIMTCAGEMRNNGDSTHRLIITASV